MGSHDSRHAHHPQHGVIPRHPVTQEGTTITAIAPADLTASSAADSVIDSSSNTGGGGGSTLKQAQSDSSSHSISPRFELKQTIAGGTEVMSMFPQHPQQPLSSSSSSPASSLLPTSSATAATPAGSAGALDGLRDHHQRTRLLNDDHAVVRGLFGYNDADLDDDETDQDTEDGILRQPNVRVQFPMMGTPSTVSTDPSTDDASFNTDGKFEEFTSMLPNLLDSAPGVAGFPTSTSTSRGHRRIGSWEDAMQLSASPWTLQPQPNSAALPFMGAPVPAGAALPTPSSTSARLPPQQRVASFRHENLRSGANADQGHNIQRVFQLSQQQRPQQPGRPPTGPQQTPSLPTTTTASTAAATAAKEQPTTWASHVIQQVQSQSQGQSQHRQPVQAQQLRGHNAQQQQHYQLHQQQHQHQQPGVHVHGGAQPHRGYANSIGNSNNTGRSNPTVNAADNNRGRTHTHTHANAHAHAHAHQHHQAHYGSSNITATARRNVPYGGSHMQSRSRSLTPPRNARSMRTTPASHGGRGHGNASGQSPGSPHHGGMSGTHRSSSEILKTLLRKKACLYEPDTSRAVALVTWLVGRELAMEYGYFSRQQLQSGVHACVAAKIDDGTITRTKVNRCMQIILNSCFHYIIPRSDGTEENGESFRAAFSPRATDDSALLKQLPSPWDKLTVQRHSVLQASKGDGDDQSKTKASTTPKSSPRLQGMSGHVDDEASKRAVLLCFNENVRCAEDVFRCHNEFIRDTANASHLQLSADEWKAFFGCHGPSPRAGQFPWSIVGVPLGNIRVHGQHQTQAQMLMESQKRPIDILGQMSANDAAKFRSTWCSKRYDHNHELCAFAHVEINGGWLRRDPQVHNYEAVMCPHVTTLVDSTSRDAEGNALVYHINECPHGVHCNKAHSKEEILYAPGKYKARLCSAAGQSRSRGCRLGDVCPDLHPPNSGVRPMKKAPDNRHHHHNHNHHSHHHNHNHGNRQHSKKNESATQKSNATANVGGQNHPAPSPAPILYASPAPISDFERNLGLPGLKDMYRRHCSVLRAYHRSNGTADIHYSCFGDDDGIGYSATDPHQGQMMQSGNTASPLVVRPGM
mmetsp:Transcript_17679/g.50066  ORF Transcript_17679/g.50066 Transcript_17679/m.50066 type:complete len:1089 (-) Transcript_17679:373-3639(-)